MVFIFREDSSIRWDDADLLEGAAECYADFLNDYFSAITLFLRRGDRMDGQKRPALLFLLLLAFPQNAG